AGAPDGKACTEQSLAWNQPTEAIADRSHVSADQRIAGSRQSRRACRAGEIVQPREPSLAWTLARIFLVVRFMPIVKERRDVGTTGMKRGLETSAGFLAFVIPTASRVSLSRIVRFMGTITGTIPAGASGRTGPTGWTAS